MSNKKSGKKKCMSLQRKSLESVGPSAKPGYIPKCPSKRWMSLLEGRSKRWKSQWRHSTKHLCCMWDQMNRRSRWLSPKHEPLESNLASHSTTWKINQMPPATQLKQGSWMCQSCIFGLALNQHVKNFKRSLVKSRQHGLMCTQSLTVTLLPLNKIEKENGCLKDTTHYYWVTSVSRLFCPSGIAALLGHRIV